MTSDILREGRHLFLGSRLKRLAEQMQADVILVAQRAGLPIQPGQYPLLAALDERGPQTIGELALAMRMSQPAVTKNAGRLAEAGLVEISRSDSDRRQKRVSLSADGERAMAVSKREVWPLIEAAVRAVTDDLSGPLLEQIAEIETRLAARPLNRRAADAAPLDLVPAADADIPAVVALMNLAYRGRDADPAWTEVDYIDGDRTTEALLRQDMAASPEAVLLLWRQLDGALLGCVWLEPEDDGAWYLGSLAIDLRRQNGGQGRRLLAAAEDWARAHGGVSIRMTVVNVREALLAWYARRGYDQTGETEPFPYGDDRFGAPKRDDLCFVVLRKRLG